MRRVLKRSAISILLAGASAAAHGYSNPIEGGAVQTVTNQWAVSVPWLVVGSNSDSNTLVVVEGGEVNNSIAYLGNTVGSSHNEVQVQGAGAVWNSSMELTIGHLGGTNTLTICDGGVASTDSAYIGKNSDRNRAIISDAGSLLVAENLYVGYQGDSNAMAVANGARVESTDADIGYWIGADGNRVTVDGSLWTNSGALIVGNYGSGNTLSVSNGGQVETSVLNVGAQAMASNNLVSVFDEGSQLNASEINIGGNGNLVEVQNGGTIATELLTIQNGGVFDLNDGGTFAINNDFNVSTNGFNWNDGGHLRVSGNLEGMPVATRFSSSYDVLDGNNKTLTLDGGTWTNSSSAIAIGFYGDNNAMVITNGGYVKSGSSKIGGSGSAQGNSVVV
uniref:hypothetical protein n=1 Tax=Pontiella sp. TaxID=2837462 RepID=UPI003569F5D2